MPRIYKKKSHCIRGHELTPENRIGGKGQCKLCSKINWAKQKLLKPNYKKEWRQKHKERLRLEHISNRYNLTIVEYQDLLKKQENKCAICRIIFNNTLANSTPHVDHNHKTNKVRGLLCRMCNSGLGQFKDNTDNLLNAIEYLNTDGILQESNVQSN